MILNMACKRKRILALHRLEADMDWLPVLKVAISLIVLILASHSDWKKREASDAYWLFLGTAGLVFLAAQMIIDGADSTFFLILIPITILFYDLFWDRKGIFEDGVNPVPLGMYAVALVPLGALFYLEGSEQYFWELMIIPILFVVFVVMYYLNLIKGGADAKAMIALSIMFPLYPVFEPFPLIALPNLISELVIPFPIVVLFTAALLSLVVPVVLFFLNLARGDRKFPAMFLGYRMPLSEAKGKFVWPMEFIEDGERKLMLFPKGVEDTAEQLTALESAGADKIWVTPQVPFLIPITAGLLFTAVVGNVFFIFLG